jgi:hypothetical protein
VCIALTDTYIPSGITRTIASGTATMATAEIAANSCASVVTVVAANVASTDVIVATPNASWAAITGFGPGGGLSIRPYPTTGNVNF